MTRRWILRSFFIAALTFCAVGWPWSHLYMEDIVYNSHSNWGCSTGIYGGICFFSPFWGHQGPDDDPGLEYFHETYGGLPLLDGYREDTPHKDFDLLGFHLSFTTDKHGLWSIEIPFWFLTPVSAACLLLVWRKTRSLSPTRAFPVETTTA